MTRYVDEAAFEHYQDFDGQEIVATQLVAAPPGEVFDAFLADVWKGMAVGEVHPGSGRGMQGHVRKVPLGIQEEILSAGEPNDNDDEAIPTILYRLVKFGPIAAKDHRGFVQFVKDTSSATPKTLVIWSVKTVPSTVGNVLFCGGSLMRLALRGALVVMLRNQLLSGKLHGK